MNNKNQDLLKKEKFCYFCVNQTDYIDYKDVQLLKKFTNSFFKILPKKRTGTCAKHQRKLATAIKRSRVMALLPYSPR